MLYLNRLKPLVLVNYNWVYFYPIDPSVIINPKFILGDNRENYLNRLEDLGFEVIYYH